MTKKTTISSQQHLRIKKVSTLEQIEKLKQLRTGEQAQINTILNDALELALPCLIERTKPESFATALEKHTQRLIMNQNRQTQKIITNLQKLSILASINESMTSSIIHELEYFMRANGTPIPEELLAEFIKSIPDRFEEQKQFLIEKLLEDNNE